MDEEILYELENLLSITYQIYDVYEELINLEINKKELDYKTKKDAIISKLKTLKNEENESYNFFQNNLAYTISTIHYINHNIKQNLKEKDILPISRVINNLSIISSRELAMYPEMVSNGSVNTSAIQLLTKAGYSEDDSTSIVLKLVPIIDKSLSTAVFNTINYYLNFIQNDNMRKIYINRKYYEAFKFGNSFEDELIKNDFKPLKNILKEEMNDIFEGSNALKQQILTIILEPQIKQLIEQFIVENEPEKQDDLLIKFKAYMLHLDIPNMERYRIIINLLSVIYSFNYKVLLNEIEEIISLRKKAQNKQL